MPAASIVSVAGGNPQSASTGESGIAFDTATNRLKVNDGGATYRFTPEGQLVSATASSLTIVADTHAGRTVAFNRALGVTMTLPAATGSGTRYRFVVATAFSGGSGIIQVASSTDYFRGVSWSTQDAGDTSLSFDTADTGTVATESDTITLNGGTTGGVVGTIIDIQDIATAVWLVEMQNKASGSEATPFSVAV